MFSSRFWSRVAPSPTVMVILSVALFLRLMLALYVLQHFGPAWFFSRGSEMGFLASSVLHGRGLSAPFGVPTGPTAIVAPGYPLLVAGVFHLLGSYTWAAALFLMLLHAVCNTVTVYLINRLGRGLADDRAAGFMATLWACSLPLLWLPTIFWETSLSCMLTVVMLAAMVSLRQRRSTAYWAACGALCGVAGLFNPALLPSFFALTVYTLFRTSPASCRTRHLAAAVGSLALLFSPWPLRNARVFHTCVLTRTTVGLELWMGNHPGSSGFLVPALFPTNNPAELASYQQQGEIRYTRGKAQLAHAYISAHPARFVWLSAKRFVRFWTGSGTEGGSVLFRLHASSVSLLGLWGFMLLWKRGDRHACICAGILLVLFPLPYYITHAEFRYRLVLDPLLSVLATPAVAWLLAKLQQPVQKPALVQPA